VDQRWNGRQFESGHSQKSKNTVHQNGELLQNYILRDWVGFNPIFDLLASANWLNNDEFVEPVSSGFPVFVHTAVI
jgi:hypothetical protein